MHKNRKWMYATILFLTLGCLSSAVTGPTGSVVAGVFLGAARGQGVAGFALTARGSSTRLDAVHAGRTRRRGRCTDDPMRAHVDDPDVGRFPGQGRE
jgi:hypothetical protein